MSIYGRTLAPGISEEIADRALHCSACPGIVSAAFLSRKITREREFILAVCSENGRVKFRLNYVQIREYVEANSPLEVRRVRKMPNSLGEETPCVG